MRLALTGSSRNLRGISTNLRLDRAVSHQGGQVGRAARLGVVVRAVSLDEIVRSPFDRSQSGDTHGRRAKVHSSGDFVSRGEIATDFILPFDLGSVVGCSGPRGTTGNWVAAGVDCAHG